MADMILLKCTEGTKAATVLCPVCGMISRQILRVTYSGGGTAALVRKYDCPVCGEVYGGCTAAGREAWAQAMSLYERDPGAYEQQVRSGYASAGRPRETSAPAVKPREPSAPVSTPQETPAPANDALERRIERWRSALLDLGRRNRMINYRDTKRSTLKILEPSASELFGQLAFSEKALTFRKPVSREADPRTYSVIALMETMGCDLNAEVGDIKAEGTIIEREKTIRNLRSKTKLAQEEQGINILYLCFGFISWRERESAPWVKSPLLLMPASIGFKSLNAPFTLSKYDDDIVVNPTLDHLFNDQYNIDLPPFELKDRDSFDEYIDRVGKLVEGAGWKVIPEVSLGLLSFLKISMYHDLGDNRELIMRHPVLRAMAGDTSALKEIPPEARQPDLDSISSEKCFEVVDSDSSQEEAILLSKLGISFVMQGPPGTGKSQTITNIIAEALADGKKVLFVSEKSAALQVVLKRLADAQLDDFCLSLHDYKANKKEIVSNIGANLRLKDEYVDDLELRELSDLFRDRQFLNEYARQLHTPVEPLGMSIYAAFGRLSQHEDAGLPEADIEGVESITKEQLMSMQYSAEAFEKALKALGGRLIDNPWHGTRATEASQSYKQKLLSETQGLSDCLRSIDGISQRIETVLGTGLCGSFNGLEKLPEVCSALEDCPESMSPGWFDGETYSNARAAAAEAGEHIRQLNDCRSSILSGWDKAVLGLDAAEAAELFCGEWSGVYTGSDNSPKEAAAREHEAAETLKTSAASLTAAFREGRELIGAELEDTTDNMRVLSKVLGLAAGADCMEASWFDIAKNADIGALLSEAIRRDGIRRTSWEQLSGEWEASVLEVGEDVLLRFKADYTPGFLSDSSAYEADLQLLDGYARGDVRDLSAEQIVKGLETVIKVRESEEWFGGQGSPLAQSLGELYRGSATDWAEADRAAAKAESLTALAPQISEAVSCANEISTLTGELTKGWLPGILSLDPEPLYGRFTGSYTESFIKDRAAYDADIKALRLCSKHSEPDLDEQSVTGLLQRVRDLRTQRRWLTENSAALSAAFGSAFTGESSDISALQKAAERAQKLCVSEKLISEAVSRAAALNKTVALLQADWEPTVFGFDSEAMLNRFKADYNGLFHKTKASYKEDMRTLRIHAKTVGARITDDDAVELLMKLKTLREQKAWFAQMTPQLSAALGELYSGDGTDWSRVGAELASAQMITKQNGLTDGLSRCITAVSSGLEDLQRDWEPSVTELDAEAMLGRYKTVYTRAFRETCAAYDEDCRTMQSCASTADPGDRGAVLEMLRGLRTLAEKKQRLAALGGELSGVLGGLYTGEDTDWQKVSREVERSRALTGQKALMAQAAAHAAEQRQLMAELSENWLPGVTEVDIRPILDRFIARYDPAFLELYKTYSADMKLLCGCRKNTGSLPGAAQAAAALQTAAEYKAEAGWLAENRSAVEAALGRSFGGGAPDWGRVFGGVSAAAQITEIYPNGAVPEKVKAALTELALSTQLSGEARRIASVLSGEAVDSFEQGFTGAGYAVRGASVSGLMPWLESRAGDWAKQLRYTEELTAAKSGELTYSDITALIDLLTAADNEKQWFAGREAAHRELFGDAYNGTDTPWEQIGQGLAVADRLGELFEGSVPEALIEAVCGRREQLAEVLGYSRKLPELLKEAAPKLDAFSAQFTDTDFRALPPLAAAERYDACLNGFDELNKWIDVTETRAECDRCGLADLTAKLTAPDCTVTGAAACFEKAFFSRWITVQLEKIPAVKGFHKRIHEQKLEHFISLDKGQQLTARKRIRQKIISTFPDQYNVVRAGSEMGILNHEMNKKMRIMPLRKLFRSIPNLLLTLKPCLMMSPLSVAYFLNAQDYQFDTVIFDEASQIFPQDAVGAIFRGKQVIIAGDTKQLPPTNFFSVNTGAEEYDDDDSWDEEICDSVLEETAAILPGRTLLWHYRSRHEHLIAFSNKEIYQNELVTFPGSSESEPDTGVEFVYVEDGYYEPSPKNHNTVEAKRIVSLVKEHIENHPERSLGVIAFSEKQQQAILSEIQRFREKEPKYEDFFAERSEGEFFVKNLENVQGDERDTIIFSIGYARTKQQIAEGRRMSMRFGPLSLSGGERRLNVAVTRAKLNVKLVSSILPSDIDLSATASEGVRLLRSYIEFARDSRAVTRDSRMTRRPDLFAEHIARFIEAQGFTAERNVGCSEYRIDVAVRHPSETVKQFAAGIECDGISYSLARTARDRDRLRSSVLRGMGWELYRVWSAEWYKNPELEGQKLIAFIRSAIEKCDEKLRQQEQQRLEEEKRKQEQLAAEAARREEEQKQKQQKDAERKAARKQAQEPAKDPEDKPVIAVGAEVAHKKWGRGVITELSTQIVSVRFGRTVRMFENPSAFKDGVLTLI